MSSPHRRSGDNPESLELMSNAEVAMLNYKWREKDHRFPKSRLWRGQQPSLPGKLPCSTTKISHRPWEAIFIHLFFLPITKKQKLTCAKLNRKHDKFLQQNFKFWPEKKLGVCHYELCPFYFQHLKECHLSAAWGTVNRFCPATPRRRESTIS